MKTDKHNAKTTSWAPEAEQGKVWGGNWTWRVELSANIAWQQTAHNIEKWRNGEEDFLLQWSEIGSTEQLTKKPDKQKKCK